MILSAYGLRQVDIVSQLVCSADRKCQHDMKIASAGHTRIARVYHAFWFACYVSYLSPLFASGNKHNGLDFVSRCSYVRA